MADDDLITSFVNEFLKAGRDDATKVAKDFLFDPWAFADDMADAESKELILRIRAEFEFQIQIFGNSAIYNLSPVMFVFVGLVSLAAMRVQAQFGYDYTHRSDEEFRNQMLKLFFVHENPTMSMMQTNDVKVLWIQATTLKRKSKAIIWKGQLKNVSVADDGDSQGFKTYNLIYQETRTLVDNRTPDE